MLSSFITDDMMEIIVTHTNTQITVKPEKYRNVKVTQRQTDANEI